MNRSMLLGVAGLLPLAAVSNAAVLYDNISASTGATSAGDAGVSVTNSHGPLGDSFSTGSNPGFLSDVKVLVSADTPTDGFSFDVSLLSDNSTSPGTVISQLGTISDGSLPMSQNEAVVDIPVNTPIPLAPFTRYWIELSGTDSSGNWSYDTNNVGIGVANEYNFYSGSVSANSGFTPYQMTVTTSVPEPGTLGMTVLAAAGVASRRRRRFAE